MSHRERSTEDMIGFARRIIRALGARVADADEWELAELAALEVELQEALTKAVAGQMRYGRSWQHIGDAFGISRQAAFKRYAARIAEHSAPAGEGVG